MSYEFYKILHIFCLLLLFAGLIGVLCATLATPNGIPKSLRLPLVIIHGVGALGLLVSGFGMAARLGLMTGLPNWVYAKIVIWLILGGSIALAKRKAQWGMPLLMSWILLGGMAAYLAILKPL